MSKLFFSAIAFIFLINSSLYPQKSIWTTKDAYLGQQPPGDIPEVFGTGMLAKADTFAFDRVGFSDDGKELYFPGNNIWFSGVNAKVR